MRGTTLLLLLAACDATTHDSARVAPSSPTTTPAAAAVLAGFVQLDAQLLAVSGKLAVSWVDAGEQRELLAGNMTAKLVSDLLLRLRVLGDVQLGPGSRVPFSLPLDTATSVAPVVFVAPPGRLLAFFATGDGEGTAYTYAAPLRPAGSTAPVDVVLDRVHHVKPREEACKGERVELVVLEAPGVAGRVGNTTQRRLCVHLPPSYARSQKRYPVVYAFSGFGGTDTNRVIGSKLGEQADELAAQREAIVVGVDTSTRTGSSYLVDSPRTGAWDTFMARTVVQAIDQRYRTVARGSARAVLGQSTGGFNAISIAMRHPDVFGAAAAMSPDALVFAPWFLTPDRNSFQPLPKTWMRMEAAMGEGPGQFVSYASDWSYDDSARGFAWPIDLRSGKLVPAVWQRWLEHEPASLLERPERKAAILAQLSGSIYLTVGRSDEFGLFEPTRLFGEALQRASIAHVFVPTEGGHFEGQPARQRAALAFLLERLGR